MPASAAPPPSPLHALEHASSKITSHRLIR
jgi:hypothetical protein